MAANFMMRGEIMWWLRWRNAISVPCVAALLSLATGCEEPSSTTEPARDAQDRFADAAVVDPLGESVNSVVYLSQNWSPEDSERFYFTTQGSQVVPYDWFLVLERADSDQPFRDNRNMLGYRYLVQKPSRVNPDGLPVGLTIDRGIERSWLGFTCAACHTGQIDYEGVGYRIDGGPATADVRGFLVGLTQALEATHDQEEKFDRFAKKLLANPGSAADRAALKDDLAKVIARRRGYNERNFPSDALPGHGRVDAFGAILNEVYHHAIVTPPGTSATANTMPANAPVSYPVLWDTPQHDKIQWNGAAENKGLGALGRNVGEVLGVFGDFEIPEHPTQAGYASSVRIRNLLALEDWVKTLWSPKWPSAFPPIDEAKSARGEALYAAHCVECHALIDRDDPARKVTAVMKAVGTDSRMADNFNNRAGRSGKLEGAYVRVIRWPPLNPPKIGATSSADEILSHTVVGTILGTWREAPEDQLSEIEYRRRPVERELQPVPVGGVYKARPLNGIWASAPYLHNGSVASLHELLLPSKDRLRSFNVGTRQFDPVNVGFRTNAAGFPWFIARDDDGRPVAGNSNEGHEHASTLSEDERLDLLEYLKSL